MSDSIYTGDGISAFDRAASHPNPAFDFLTGFAPRKLKDLFKWSEYLLYQSAHIYASFRKFGELVVTSFEYNTDNAAARQRWKHAYERTLKMKSILLRANLDKNTYGNYFISLYLPFTRQLACNSCGQLVNIARVNYRFDLKKFTFTYPCPHCKATVTGRVVDRKIASLKKIHVIRWDPKQIDIDYNPITGESVYYYNIPQDIKDKVKAGSKHHINSMPMEFLQNIRDGKTFRFEPGAIFHSKVPSPAGIDQQWGFPPLSATLKLFLYTMVLRKANEAIAMEHIVPFRVLHPAPSQSGVDPLRAISMDNWQQQLQSNIRRFRRDPLHVMFSPTPLGVSTMGGDGRAMLTIGEVQEAEKNIMAALGVPAEFLFGGLTRAGMDATLRLIENQTQNDADDLNELLQWLTDRIATYLGWETIEVGLTPLKMVDDTENRNLMVSLATGQNGAAPVALTTIGDRLGIDFTRERERRLQEAVDEAKLQQRIQVEMQKIQNTLAQQVQSQMQMAGSGGLGYDQQAVIARADEFVQQLLSVDTGTRRSYLHSLQTEDAVMYAVVIQRLEEAQNQQAAAARAQTQPR